MKRATQIERLGRVYYDLILGPDVNAVATAERAEGLRLAVEALGLAWATVSAYALAQAPTWDLAARRVRT